MVSVFEDHSPRVPAGEPGTTAHAMHSGSSVMIQRKPQTSIEESGRSPGEDIAWWTRKIIRLLDESNDFLDQAAARLERFGLIVGASVEPTAHAAGRRILIARGDGAIDRAYVLETHLVPISGAEFPLLVAACVRLRCSVPQRLVCQELAMDPPLERFLPANRRLESTRIPMSNPLGLVKELQLRAWPLFELEDDQAITKEVVPVIARWTLA